MTLHEYFMSNAALKREWAFDKNVAEPEKLKPHSREKVWWRCARGHEWQAAVDSRVYAGNGCPCCANQKVIPGENDMATVAAEMAGFWHPTANGSLTPSEVSPGSKRYIWWQCHRGHSWRAPAYSIKRGDFCPYCSGREAIPGETDLATLRPDILAEWDAEKNAPINPGEILPSSHGKVWWRCALGHSYQAAVFSRTREKSTGCPYCAGRLALKGFNDLATVKPGIAGEWHQPLNGALKPEEVTPGCNRKVWWQCRDGHVWLAAVYSRTRKRGSGCPVCAGTVKQRSGAVEPTIKRKKTQSRTAADTRPASMNT